MDIHFVDSTTYAPDDIDFALLEKNIVERVEPEPEHLTMSMQDNTTLEEEESLAPTESDSSDDEASTRATVDGYEVFEELDDNDESEHESDVFPTELVTPAVDTTTADTAATAPRSSSILLKGHAREDMDAVFAHHFSPLATSATYVASGTAAASCGIDAEATAGQVEAGAFSLEDDLSKVMEQPDQTPPGESEETPSVLRLSDTPAVPGCSTALKGIEIIVIEDDSQPLFNCSPPSLAASAGGAGVESQAPQPCCTPRNEPPAVVDVDLLNESQSPLPMLQADEYSSPTLQFAENVGLQPGLSARHPSCAIKSSVGGHSAQKRRMVVTPPRQQLPNGSLQPAAKRPKLRRLDCFCEEPVEPGSDSNDMMDTIPNID